QIYGGFDPKNGITDLTHNRIVPDENTSVVDGTILSGDIDIPNDNSDNAYHVVISSGDVGSALLNGVTITQGSADGSVGHIRVNGHTVYKFTGGGMFNTQSSPVLTHISIRDNRSRSSGGGMYNARSHPTLTHVSISGNNGESGGGLYNAFSTPLLTHVNISANTASKDGGGIYNEISSPKLTYVNIRNNTAK